MKDSYIGARIVENQEIYPRIYRLRLAGDFKGEPGQFYMLRGWEYMDPFLARPISIAQIDKESMTLLYEEKGRGTHIISQLKEGDRLSLLGPLGQGFHLDTSGRIGLVAGGIGIAPLLYLAKELKQQGLSLDLYAGFREEAYFLDEFREYVENIYISTEKGGQGHKGYVTDLLEPGNYDKLYTCGPLAMMKNLYNISRDQVELEMSMESRMACGIGACMGCTIETLNGMERVCKEGPVFKAREVIFND